MRARKILVSTLDASVVAFAIRPNTCTDKFCLISLKEKIA